MPPRPNLLWIVTTQWRAQAFGHAGDPNARTPHLDAFAARATRFRQAVTPHPFGPFARAALLTGKPSPENGIRDYFDPLPADARTVAHTLTERGYTTAFFGKWHLARRDPHASLVGEPHARMVVPPEARGGFAFWEGFESGFLLNDPWLHGTRLPEPQQMHGYQSDVVCARAATWLAEIENGKSKSENPRPWFCLVSVEAPHPPYDVPAAGISPRDPREIVLAPNVPRGGEIEAKARRELAGYYVHIEATDRAIGRLIANVRDDVVIVFTSVHGDMHGAHGLFRKGWPHEESIRVPLLIRGRRRERGGQIDERPISLVDLSELMLAEIENRESGIENSHARISMPSVVALPHQCDREWFGYRTATRKLILNADTSPWLYFDLRDDPFEMRNLIDEPARAGEIAANRAQFLAMDNAGR